MGSNTTYMEETVDFNGKTVTSQKAFEFPKEEKIAKTIHFTIPPGMNKDKNELTEYLKGMKVVKETEEPGLDLANQSAKLFCFADRLVFTVNNGDHPTHLFTVELNNVLYSRTLHLYEARRPVLP